MVRCTVTVLPPCSWPRSTECGPIPQCVRNWCKAVRLIVDTQNDEGGWRYQPERREADISVTICQVMALRAARNAGVYVSNETIDRCTAYVKQCQNSDGGFAYMLPGWRECFSAHGGRRGGAL